MQQRNDKKRAERESFLLTTIPITRQAAREPALDHAADDHVERESYINYYYFGYYLIHNKGTRHDTVRQICSTNKKYLFICKKKFN